MTRISILAAGVLAIAAAGIAAPVSAATAVFAGGCFWCTEADFDKVEGVTETISGFTGGSTPNPVYPASGSDHYEAVKVTYDPDVVTYDALLDVYWHSVDATDDGGQFCDRGHTYKTAVFVDGPEQRAAAEASKEAVAADLAINAEIVTPILDANEFWPVDDYHQNYWQSEDRVLSRFGFVTKAEAYKGYREGCGRDRRLEQVWGDTALQGTMH